MTSEADFFFFGGNIITMDENNPSAEALAVKGDKIQAVGKFDDVLALTGQKTEFIYLNHQTLLPGFIEPHQHAIMIVMNRARFIDISGYNYKTYEQVKEVIAEEIAELKPKASPTSFPGSHILPPPEGSKMRDPGNEVEASPLPWAIFFGWDPELIPNLPKLSADFLDKEFSSTIPIAIVGQSGHVVWVNNKAFEIAKVDDTIEDIDGGIFVKDKDGHLTGQLFESSAIGKVLGAAPKPTLEELKAAVLEQWREYSACGFTTVTDLLYTPDEVLDPLIEEISLENTCPVRLALYRRVVSGPGREATLANRKRTECCPRLFLNDGRDKARPGGDEEGRTFTPNPKLWEAGVKLVADGSPHCGTAAVREPFLNSSLTQTLGFPPAPCYGNLNHSTQDLLKTVKFYHQRGTQIAIHAHGERAIDQVIGVYEQVLKESEEPKDMRHRVEHLGLCTVGDIARAAKLNLALSFFVCHLYFYAKSYTEHIFGAERTNRWTPLSEATKHGIRWSIHQDQPTFPGPPTPFTNLKTAVTRTHRNDKDTIYGLEYCVSIHEAMKAVTIDAAWQIHKDDILGSLMKNKKADLLILSKNPYEVDPFELEQIKVLETFIDGRRNELNKTYSVNIAGGTVKMYADESEKKSMDGPVKSMKRKGGSPPMQLERKTAKNKRQ